MTCSRSSVPPPLVGYLRELHRLCRRYAVQRLAGFGSVTREDFDPDGSDLDLTVEFAPPARSVRSTSTLGSRRHSNASSVARSISSN